MTAQEKKVYYNRVRRTCKLHEIEIVYDGVPKMYCKPLDIDWRRLHEEMTEYGYKGGIK